MFGDDHELALARERALQRFEEMLLVFGTTHDSGLFPDQALRVNVWREFAADPAEPRALLLETHHGKSTPEAAAELRGALAGLPSVGARPSRIAAVAAMLVVHLDFRELVRHLLPCTAWWAKRSPDDLRDWPGHLRSAVACKDVDDLRQLFAQGDRATLWRFTAAWAAIESAADAYAHAPGKRPRPRKREMCRWTRLFEVCSVFLAVAVPETYDPTSSVSEKTIRKEIRDAFQRLLDRNDDAQRAFESWKDAADRAGAGAAPIWAIDLNRPAELASAQSRRTVKLDAAESVFRTSTARIRWAVVDSGIDARHPAFAKTDADEAAPGAARSRVVATYDFVRLRHMLEGKFAALLPAAQLPLADALVDPGEDTSPSDRDEAVLMLLFARNAPIGMPRLSTGDFSARLAEPETRLQFLDYCQDVRQRITQGEHLDWPLLEPLLRVSHDDGLYQPPQHGHGSHVAGILAGRASPDDETAGMCPDLQLYDLRVADGKGQSDEFLVMAALQFIAWLNRVEDRQVVHGANLSLQIRHQVRSYGCGQTPVCREADRLVDSGVCVVSAAGNHGFRTLRSELALVDSYSWSSIMDPGNAAKVITVGSTHRSSPHTYGISYFSSRGPTGDGRSKPDLVAPGEKIRAPAIPSGYRRDSGTSMAAPHVSGAAAFLMARNLEFVGRPLEVKRILCQTATDLGRSRELQGAGLLDALRALESI